MKQLKFFALALTLLMGISLTSCFNDEDDPIVKMSLLARYDGGYYGASFTTVDGVRLIPADQSVMLTLTEGLYSIYFQYNRDEVPEGATAEDNLVVKVGGMETELPKDALPHWELAKKYDIIDFDLGVKITGAGFPVYKGKGARLQRALINFFLDEARASGYTEIMPPTVVNAASGYGTGQLPDKEGQMYHCEVDDLYLIPTAEVPVTNIYRDVILDEKQLPIKNCAYTECFRREAGSYGKDVRGLNRLHEFSKVELVRIDKPEHSKQSHQEMLDHVEGLLKKLELPYRILRLCGGDMSFTAAICYDFEVYSEAQKRWLEVSSVSNFDTYQANRLKCRYRTGEKKTELCHTLNGSALALPRIVAALLENNQTPEGIRIPKALVPYCGFDMID